MFSQSPIIKTGVAFKKGSGAGLFHRQNWKQRYLVLTLDALYYYDQEHHGHLKGCIDLSTCDMESLEVMPADCVKTGHSAASEWRVAIQTPDRRFVFAAPCEKDMREWVFALTSVLRANERRMQDHYFTKSMGHNHHHIQNPHRSLTAPSSRPR